MQDLTLSDDARITSRLARLGYNSTIKAVIFQPRGVGDFKHLSRLASSDTLVLGSAQDGNLIRKLLEDKRVDGVVNIESSTGREHTHYRQSNVNQVLAKIAYDKEKFYCIDFSRILHTQVYNRYILLGRIMQNIRILRKYRVPITIATFARDAYGLRTRDTLEAFCRVLGARKVAKVENLLRDKQERSDGEIIREGVRVLD